MTVDVLIGIAVLMDLRCRINYFGSGIVSWPGVLHLHYMCAVLFILHVQKYKCITCLTVTCVIHRFYTCVDYTPVQHM